MSDVDRPDYFYLGREYDLERKTLLDKPVYYDSHNLTTHGVVVGMTGSGKTGLCIDLLEEAALQGIPCIVIDLKGDLSNLLLNFPDMDPKELEPWIDPDEARRKNLTTEQLVQDRIRTWRQGLADWGQSPARVARLREAADWRIYTPGSEAGLPVSVIQNFAAPAGPIDRETLNERIEATTTALLGLTKIMADPVQSREHILIANLLLNAWTNGHDLDLPRLISEITNPPLRTIGTFDVDMFYPEDERLRLALTLNNLLASPSFSTWLNGEPLSLSSMLYGPGGKPRQLIFYLSHLEDSQRMFFLTLLLGEALAWTRSQPGTSSLRAILYFDELFGYLPPYPANPPTKRPLMTLLKQARAFGVGLLLATQNPVDIDYKALSNAGTWFVGKLQTDRDKARLLEGLQSVAAERDSLTDTSHLDTVISSLGNRIFLLHNVHSDKPILFHTRWALSYLYGPMTRDHIAQIMASSKKELMAAGLLGHGNGHIAGIASAAGHRACQVCQTAAPGQARFCMHCGVELAASAESVGTHTGAADHVVHVPDSVNAAHVPPVLPPGLTQFFLMEKTSQGDDAGAGAILYQPRILGFAEVQFNDKRYKLEYRHVYRMIALAPDAVHPEPWTRAEEIPEALNPAHTPPEGLWAEVPETLNDPKKLRKLEQAFVYFLYKNAGFTLYHNHSLGLLSTPQEDQETFLERCRSAAEDTLTSSGESATGAENASDGDGAVKTKSRTGRSDKGQKKNPLDIKEIRLSLRKSDVRVTHFGLAWAPYRDEKTDGQDNWVPAYDGKPIPADAWHNNANPTESIEES